LVDVKQLNEDNILFYVIKTEMSL